MNDNHRYFKRIQYLTSMFILVIVPALIFSSCTSAQYEKQYDLPDMTWHQDSIYSFEFEVKDVSVPYNINYHLRNTLAYPNHNLYMQYFLEDENHVKIGSQVQEVQLMEKRTGRPYGKGFTGNYQNKFLAISYKFPKEGKYYFKIRQYMRKEKIEGIVSLGISVEKLSAQ